MNHDFHDSELISLSLSPDLLAATVVLSSYDKDSERRSWQINFIGVLRMEFETLGDGLPNKHGAPIQIHDLYADDTSQEKQRWIDRLENLSVRREDLSSLKHIVLASSFNRGWGENGELEGISIVCRDVEILDLD